MREDRRGEYYQARVRDSGPQYPGFDLPSAEVAVSFIHTYDLMHQMLGRAMADFGLSKSTVNVLMLLRHGPPEGMQLHDLGELLLVSRANVTGLIDHLEEKGYVKRFVNSNDRRGRYARITKKGEALLDEFMPLHYRRVKTLLQDLSMDEKQSLVNLLKKMRLSIAVHSDQAARDSLEVFA